MADNSRMQLLHEEVLLTVGALSAGAAKTQQTKIDSAREQGFSIKKAKYNMVYSGKTDGEGPVLFGYSIGLTAVEIAEALDADPQSSQDAPAVDEANRRVYPLEWIPIDSTESSRAIDMRLKRYSIPWTIDEGITLSWFVRANGALTTGMLVKIASVYYGEWQRD